jgi:gamma-glutamylputrescine oxidase
MEDLIGGGAAGLAAAARLMGTGKKVVLLERNICEGSSTGKSAGFMTPDSELEPGSNKAHFKLAGPTGIEPVWGPWLTLGLKARCST